MQSSSQTPNETKKTEKKRHYYRKKPQNDKFKPDSEKPTEDKAKSDSEKPTEDKAKPEKPKRSRRPKRNNHNEQKKVENEKDSKEKVENENENNENNNSENDDNDDDVCFICTEPIDYYALAPCGHRTCHMCTLRLRALYQTKNCAYCKVEANKVVFTKDSEKLYEKYRRDDTPFFDKKHGIRFETEDMYLDTQQILQFQCPDEDCKESCNSSNEIKKHVKETHKKQLCDLCLRNKKIFSHEHTLYTSAQLHKHHREGDSSFAKSDETGFTGHPECVFCKTRFYDSDELFDHCRKKHEQCHICTRQGIQHQYYANYENLEKHFEKDHYLCLYRECLNNKFVVFATDIDLKAHEIDEHGSSLSRQQRAKQGRVDIDLNFSNSNRNTNRSRSQPKQNLVNLTSDDFPDINGSPSSAQLMTQRMAALQVNGNQRDNWPGLGEERQAVVEENNTSPAISRQAAAFDRIADLFKNLDKTVKFRQYLRQFEEGTIDSKKWIDISFKLCDENDAFYEKIFKHTKDLVNTKAHRIELERAWNHRKNPNTAQPQVLVVNPKKPKSVRGTWDKVALAAKGAGGSRSIKTTPWATTAPSEADIQSLFPALPKSDVHSTRRADINAMIKRNEERRTWGESSTSMPNTDVEDSDTTQQKKKKKGKQVLFRVGL